MSDDAGEVTPDEILMAAYQAGNEAAFGELFGRHAGSVYRFLVRRLADRSLADDLFQEAFLRLHRARHTYDSTRSFRAWLFGIVHNLVVDAMRSRSRLPETTSLDDVREAAAERQQQAELGPDYRSPERLVAARQSTMALSRALRALPSDEATALILARLEGLSYDDIAEVLGRSAAATKQLAYRALKRVTATMKAEGHEEET